MWFTVWVHAWIHYVYMSVCPCCMWWVVCYHWMHSLSRTVLQSCFFPSWHNSPQCPPGARPTEGPYACIPPQLRCFSLGPLTASTTTLMPSHGGSYERYVVCKLLSPHFRHQLHFEPQYISSFSSPCLHKHTHTHRAEGNRKHMDVNHAFGGITSQVKGAAEWSV